MPSRPAWQVVAAIAMSLPAIFLVGPFVPQLFAAFGPDAGPVLAGLAALLVASAAPAMGLVLGALPRGVPLAVAAIAAGCAALGNWHAPFDRDHPRPDTVLFAVDGDTGRGWWLSPDPEAPRWAAAAFAGATRGRAPLPYPLADLLAAAAPAAREPGPEITWLEEAPAGAGRAMRLRIVPPAGTELLAVQAGDVLSARVEGQSLPIDGGSLAFRFYAPPAAGVEIQLTTASRAPIVVRAVTQHGGFPVGMSPGPRPPEAMAKPGMMPPWDDLLESDRTIVARSSSR